MTAKDIARALRIAKETKTPINPIRNYIGIDAIPLAYEIQNINTQINIERGKKITGKKIGLTSKAVQKQLGVNQPDFGILFNDMEVFNDSFLKVSEVMQAKVEAEVAFVLARDLDFPNITISDITDAIDYALPAIEIVGSRIKDWDIKITDTIADNASASHYVLGSTPKSLNEFDVVACTMEMKKNKQIVSRGTGADCLGSPLNATLWLANQMQIVGSPLKAGELILSGALGPMCMVNAGDEIAAEITGLGSVSVKFS